MTALKTSKAIAQPAPKVGQIWKEVDPRFERYVRIESDNGAGRRSIGIRTVVWNSEAGKWFEHPRSRLSYADIERFNGGRGNYQFQEFI